MRHKSKTKYSWKTSLPAYLENAEGKDMQEKLVLYVMRRLRGKTTLKEVQDYMRTRLSIRLPQSTISGRMNDLKDKDKVAFFGDTRIYKDRIRKVFEIITKRNSKKKRVGKKIIYQKVHPVLLALDRHRKGTLRLSDGAIWLTKDGGLSWKKKQKSIKARSRRDITSPKKKTAKKKKKSWRQLFQNRHQ